MKGQGHVEAPPSGIADEEELMRGESGLLSAMEEPGSSNMMFATQNQNQQSSQL